MEDVESSMPCHVGALHTETHQGQLAARGSQGRAQTRVYTGVS